MGRLCEANRLAAARFHAKVRQSMARLGRFPFSGPLVADSKNQPVREFIVEPYRFFYFVDVKRTIIWIVGVWHGAQQAVVPRLPAP